VTIVRAPREDRFTILNRSIISDDRLSFRALGLLTFILDKPDDWRIDSTSLARGEGREGRDAVRTALTELETAGYLRRKRIRREDGTFDMESTVYDMPVEQGEPAAGEPGPGIPAPVDQAISTSTDTDDCERDDATRRAERPCAARAERDELYQSIVSACGMEYGEMTTRQKKSCAVAMSELAAVGATPDEVHRRASIYPQKYHTVLTPNALANQWAALRVEGGPPQRRGESAMDQALAIMAERRANVVQLRAVGE
jgi:hypothetical protein